MAPLLCRHLVSRQSGTGNSLCSTSMLEQLMQSSQVRLAGRCQRNRLSRRNLTVKAQRDSLAGEDFGARDPFEAEITSNFGEKVLGNADTSHIIKPPEGMAAVMGIKAKHCIPCEAGKAKALSEGEITYLRQQVAGWKVVENEAGSKVLRQEITVRNFKAAAELFGRVAAVAEAEGHHPDLHLTGATQVIVDIATHSVGGLTENDFILAAKINEVELSDIIPKKKPRYWA